MLQASALVFFFKGHLLRDQMHSKFRLEGRAGPVRYGPTTSKRRAGVRVSLLLPQSERVSRSRDSSYLRSCAWGFPISLSRTEGISSEAPRTTVSLSSTGSITRTNIRRPRMRKGKGERVRERERERMGGRLDERACVLQSERSSAPRRPPITDLSLSLSRNAHN